MLHERFFFEQRFKVPVRFTHPATGVIREEQAELISDAFVKVRAQIGYRIRLDRSASYVAPSAVARSSTYCSSAPVIGAPTRPSSPLRTAPQPARAIPRTHWVYSAASSGVA
jgi:hypothetical protein